VIGRQSGDRKSASGSQENSASSEPAVALNRSRPFKSTRYRAAMASDAQHGKMIPIDPDYADLDGHVSVAVGDMIRGRCAWRAV
jgi:hypothetical protein